MPEGEMRRAPQLWEQKLARTTSVLGVGIDGDTTTSLSDESPVPGSDDGTEPVPGEPPVDDFIAPSTPVLSGTVQGIRVAWDGLNANGDPYPGGTYVEVHIATSGATFTPSSATLAGTLVGAAGFFTIGALTASTTYYVRLVGVDDAGNRTSPSTAASSQTGLTTTNDYGTATITSGAVSFDARAIGGITTTVGTTAPTSPVTGDIWLDSTGGAIVHKRWSGSAWVTQAWGSSSISANAITATQIAAGAVTAGAIAANAITAEKINASAVTADKISADAINGKTITGATVQTATGTGARVVLDTAGIRGFNSSNQERFNLNATTGEATVTGSLRTAVSGARVEMGTAFSSLSAVSLYGASGLVGAFLTNPFGSGTIIGANGQAFEIVGSSVKINPATTIEGALSVAGNVTSQGIKNNTTASSANVRINASALLLEVTSTVRHKDQLVPLTDDLQGVTDHGKLASFPASVDPYDVLTLTPTEFRSLAEGDDNARMLGFIAEDVAEKFPWAANWNEQGVPSAVEDRPMIAALLAVVKDQQATIQNLSDRLDALEA